MTNMRTTENMTSTSSTNPEKPESDDIRFLTLLTELTNASYDCGAFVFEYGTEEEQDRYNKLLEKVNWLNQAVIDAYRKKGKADAKKKQQK